MRSLLNELKPPEIINFTYTNNTIVRLNLLSLNSGFQDISPSAEGGKGVTPHSVGRCQRS